MNNLLNNIIKKSSQLLIPLLLLAVFIGLSIFARNHLSEQEKNRFNYSVSKETQEISVSTRQQIELYSSVLLAARGLMDVQGTTDSSDWETFVDAQQIDINLPSLSVIALIDRFDEDGKEKYNNIQESKIYPDSNGDEYYVIRFVQPIEGNEVALGFDLFSDSSRREAIEFARDTNSIAITAPISLVQDSDEGKSFLMILPIYKQGSDISSLESRRENIIGLVTGVVRANTLFSEVFNSLSLNLVESISVADITKDKVSLLPTLHRTDLSESIGDQDLSILQIGRVNIGARIWGLEFKTTQAGRGIGVEIYVPIMLVVFGIITSMLIGISLSSSKKLQIDAEQRAGKLSISHKELEQKIDDKTNLLKKNNKDLESMVAERTKELKKSKLGLEENVASRTLELKEKIEELSAVNNTMINRELKMIELKEEIKTLKQSNNSNSS